MNLVGSEDGGSVRMLVLSRKPGEEILIGDDVRLVVHRIAGGRVTLGIVAPREVAVLRAELRSADGTSDDATARVVPSPAA